MNSPNDTPPVGEFILFQTEDGRTKAECRFETDTLWLTQAMLTELYGKAKATISGHISNVIEEGELDQDSVVRLFRTTAAYGKTYEVQHYSLPMVIAVGYRVRSPRGTQFRRWATPTNDVVVNA